jgi:hypothetical protein
MHIHVFLLIQYSRNSLLQEHALHLCTSCGMRDFTQQKLLLERGVDGGNLILLTDFIIGQLLGAVTAKCHA